MSRLKYVLAAQLLIFAGWAGWLLNARNSPAQEFYLDTAPVDPRDVLAGTFVALNYGISSPGTCADLLKNDAYSGPLFVKLEYKGRKAAAGGAEAQIYEPAACAGQPGKDGLWARGVLVRGHYAFADRIEYGIERFYLNEHDARKDARSGSVLAKVRLGRDHRLSLVDLVKKD